jgi:hypothetical protein
MLPCAAQHPCIRVEHSIIKEPFHMLNNMLVEPTWSQLDCNIKRSDTPALFGYSPDTEKTNLTHDISSPAVDEASTREKNLCLDEFPS